MGGGGGEVGSGWGGQGGCEQRIEVFVKIQKKKFWSRGGGCCGGSGQGGCERRIEVFVKIQKNVKIIYFFFFIFFGGGGSGRVGLGWGGVRVDVNKELKFL